MRCHECGGTYQKKKGILLLSDIYVGSLLLESAEFLQCDKCQDRLFSSKVSKSIEEARERALQGTLRAMPLTEFISASEAAELLGISRQALHKNRRINRGFIFQTQFGDKTVFLKKSVKLFRASSDGRFPLHKIPEPVSYTAETAVGPGVLHVGDALLVGEVRFSGKVDSTKLSSEIIKLGQQVEIDRESSNLGRSHYGRR